MTSLLFLVSLLVTAERPDLAPLWETNVSRAFHQAKESGKPLLVAFR